LVVGLCSRLLVLLFGVLMHTPLKNRAMGMALALGGRQWMKIPNNQLVVEGSGWINVGNEVRGW
jgi:hypothetical protein